MIEYLEKTDLFTVSADIYAHGCNCCGIMGAGIAALFANKYPDMHKEYIAYCLSHGEPKDFPGTVMFYNLSTEKPSVIANLFTQVYPGKYAKLEYIESSLRILFDYASVKPSDPPGTTAKIIAMPAVGCGIGGIAFNDFTSVLHTVHDSCSFEGTVKVCLL